MPKPFHQITVEQFVELLEKFPFTRVIDGVHMHHTWQPDHSQYKGESTINAMWEFHTQSQGWSDIAQHISIAPDGSIWTGRNWNEPPASAKGFNGSSKMGPFMFETIGNFDLGRDLLEGAQKRAVLTVIAQVQKRFKLAPKTLRFHNMMSEKSCPGSSLDYETVLREVAEVRGAIKEAPATKPRSSNFPFDDRARLIQVVIDSLKAGAGSRANETDAEGCDHDRGLAREFERTTVAGPDAARGGAQPLPPERLQALRPHVINLNLGRFSTTGRFQTHPEDVDAIFEEHLPAWADRQDKGKKLPIVFYAHGGLTSEESGLLTADEQVQWWLDNGAYPIHFVWETGLLETLQQLLAPSRQRAIDFAAPSDFLLEQLARTIGGVKIWSGMKTSAERASDAEGGARLTARRLREFCSRPEYKGRIELHAVGHSAGSIFHAHFLPAAKEEGVPDFRSLHFLAPAIRVDTFERRLLGLIGPGKGVDSLSVFTMARSFEEDDNCATVYRKSLLYLIYFALEPERKTPILGLEESIRANANLKKLFNLGSKGGSGEVIWSVSKDRTGPSATTSRTHGGFNNDAPTMSSVAHRIIGHAPTAFTGTEERGRGVLESLEAQEPGLTPFLRGQQGDFSTSPDFGGSGAAFTSSPAPALSFSDAGGRPVPGGGRRRALCIGIDRYPTAPLGGCANDARQWRDTLRRIGFEEPKLLVDEEATRSAIVSNLTDLVRQSRAGDVVVFQYAGHGTQLKDLNGDEADGDTPGLDEALCPINFASGQFVIDDDLGAIFDGIPAGVSMTVFTDCCHSGTITRLAVGTPPTDGAGSGGSAVRARFIHATKEMEEAHANFRAKLGGSRGASAPKRRGAYDNAREILFCACRSREVALESEGHGHFTTRATALLGAGVQGLTNADFQARVVKAFGPNPSQNPELHCAASLRGGRFLGGIGADGGKRNGDDESPTLAADDIGTSNSQSVREEVARILENVAQAVRR